MIIPRLSFQGRHEVSERHNGNYIFLSKNEISCDTQPNGYKSIKLSNNLD